MIDTLFLDLDGVILNFQYAERQAIGDVLDAFDCPSDERILERYSAINDGLWKAHERGELDKATLKVERFRRLIAECGFSADPTQMAAAYIDRLSKQGQTTAGAVGALRALKGRYKLYAVTNGVTVIQKGRLAAAGIERYFNGVFISEEIGFVKPQPAFFDACLRAANAKRERVLVVGDSLTADIAGANAAHIRCCLIGKAADTEGYAIDYAFDSFKAFAAAAVAGEIV